MKVILKDVQVIYPPNLFRPVLPPQATGDSKPRYSCAFVIDKNSENYKIVTEAVETECKSKLGDKWQIKAKAFKANPQKYCISEFLDSEGNETDHIVLKAYRKESDGKPLAIKKDKTQADESEGIFYSGCYVNASISIYVMSDPTVGGIRCSLGGVQFFKDGQRQGGSQADINDFEEIDPELEDGLE